MHRKILLVFLSLLLLCLTLAPAALAADPITVLVDGQALDGAFLSACTTMVPLRAFCTALDPGCEIVWDEASRTAIVRAEGLELTAQPGQGYIVANGRYLYTGADCVVSNGTLYYPVRALAKAFGAAVSWSAASNTVTVSAGGAPIAPGSEFYASDAVYWLSRIISAEARGEPLEGQIAVGNVVLNRVASSDYPNTIYGVIFDRQNGTQFTPVANGSVYNMPTESAVIAAMLVLDGANVADDSLYFLNPSIATSFWIVNNCAYVTTIGNHSFYTDTEI